MRERVELAGGAWSLETGPGRGAAVRASFVRRPAPADPELWVGSRT
jgi:hypothetical protein